MLAAAFAVTHGQAQERDGLIDRFAGRAETSAAFVTAYVDDIFARERVVAASLAVGDSTDADLARELRSAGFTASVLLDRRGRVLANTPSDPALHGVDLASQYPHLATALAGQRTVSGVVLSAVDKTPIVAFALPLDGGEQGVLSAGFSFEDSPLATFLAVTPIAGARGYIIDATGTAAVFAGDGATASLDGVDTERPLDAPLVADGRLVVAAPISGTPWRLVLTAPENAVLAPSGETGRVSWAVLALTALATLGGLIALRSVSASRRRSREALATSEQQLRLTIDHAPIGMTIVDLDGTFLQPNTQLCRMVGYEASQLREMTFHDITHPEDLGADVRLLEQLLAGEIPSYQMEKRYLRGDGSTMWARLSVSLVRDAAGKPLHFVSQIEDVTEVRAAQEKLERRALYDSLTGLANRSLLIDRLSHALADHRRDAGLLAVAFCDLDHFKRINDSLGHHAGDLLLQEVARRLQDVVRDSDTVARMGGDEFVLILSRVSSLQMAMTVLERAKLSVEQPIEIDGHSLSVSFSAGLAVGGRDHSAEMLLRDADTALYAAKENGRARLEVYTAAMRSRALMHLSVEEELRRAIKLDEFELHYQPIVRLSDRQTVAFEALLRWRHPSRGLLLPASFLDIAEESTLIVDLGQVVLRRACQFLARHPDATWRVFVNVAPIQLGRDLGGVVRAQLEAAGVRASRLGLEITENGVLHAAGSSLAEMQELRDMGIELLMDDFGTGYSALTSILTTPITGIKLDRSFTARLGKDETADRITSTVANLVESLGAHGVVEGIETEDQCVRALRHGWVHGQGYLFARPAHESTLELPHPDARLLLPTQTEISNTNDDAFDGHLVVASPKSGV